MQRFILALLVLVLSASGCTVINPPKPQYFSTEDTFIDTQTQSMWVRKIVGESIGFNGETYKVSGSVVDGSRTNATFDQAVLYLQQLNAASYAGFSDWRLPNSNDIGRLGNIAQEVMDGKGHTTVRKSVHGALVEIGFFIDGACWVSDVIDDDWANTINLLNANKGKNGANLAKKKQRKDSTQGGICPVRAYTASEAIALNDMSIVGPEVEQKSLKTSGRYQKSKKSR